MKQPCSILLTAEQVEDFVAGDAILVTVERLLNERMNEALRRFNEEEERILYGDPIAPRMPEGPPIQTMARDKK